MRKTATLILLVIAVSTAVLSLFGDDTFSKLQALQAGFRDQKKTNQKLEQRNEEMRREIAGLQNDPRAIEKAARGKLGMANQDEIVIIFDKKNPKIIEKTEQRALNSKDGK